MSCGFVLYSNAYNGIAVAGLETYESAKLLFCDRLFSINIYEKTSWGSYKLPDNF